MNIFLWVLQILVAMDIVIRLVWRFSNSEQTAPALKRIPYGAWPAISVFELLCILGLIFPAFDMRLVILAPIAALVITIEMAFFSGLHYLTEETNHGPMLHWLIIGAICSFIINQRVHTIF